VKVEQNIPMPGIFPFSQMQIGDSFLIPSNIKRSTASVAAKRYAQKHKVKFVSRKMDDGAIRMWRVE
jgi:hypothetical protein